MGTEEHGVIGKPALAARAGLVATALTTLREGAAGLISSGNAHASLHENALNVSYYKSILGAKPRIPGELPRIEFDTAVTANYPEGHYGKPEFKFIFKDDFADERRYLAIECKRVDGTRGCDLDRYYVSDGVCRFVNCKYESYYGWGVMVGYVIAGSVQGAAAAIQTRLRQMAQAAILVANLDRWAGLDDVYQSRHGRSLAEGPLHLAHYFIVLPMLQE